MSLRITCILIERTDGHIHSRNHSQSENRYDNNYYFKIAFILNIIETFVRLIAYRRKKCYYMRKIIIQYEFHAFPTFDDNTENVFKLLFYIIVQYFEWIAF